MVLAFDDEPLGPRDVINVTGGVGRLEVSKYLIIGYHLIMHTFNLNTCMMLCNKP